MTTLSKISILALILATALLYSVYEKRQMDRYFDIAEAPVLKSLPVNQSYEVFESKSPIDFEQILKSSNGLLVHFWGTWCAPCEYELPEFLEFSKSLEPYNVKVVLLAVNDEELKIKKFMKRFKDLPSNVILVHDHKNISMSSFGVVKVPETFLFNKDLKNLTKFVGPQNWKLQSYVDRVINLLSL